MARMGTFAKLPEDYVPWRRAYTCFQTNSPWWRFLHPYKYKRPKLGYRYARHNNKWYNVCSEEDLPKIKCIVYLLRNGMSVEEVARTTKIKEKVIEDVMYWYRVYAGWHIILTEESYNRIYPQILEDSEIDEGALEWLKTI